jgi:hypothetical protein
MSIVIALQYLLDRHYPISVEDAKSIGTSIKQISGDYAPVRQELWAEVYDAVFGFLNSNSQVRTYSSPMATAIAKAYIDTADIAYVDGGGSLPLDDDTLATAKSLMNEQLGYVDSMFDTLKQLRKDGDYDAISVAFQKANSWVSALDGFYNIIKMAGAGNKMLTWELGNTEKHCKDCANLDGQRHRASWYNSRGYTPRKPGSNTECGGYNCDCRLVDDDGNEFTI